jgi:ribosome maturation factor RimP
MRVMQSSVFRHVGLSAFPGIAGATTVTTANGLSCSAALGHGPFAAGRRIVDRRAAVRFLSGFSFAGRRFFVIIQQFYRSPFGADHTRDGRFAHFSFVAMDFVELIEKTVTGLGFELVDVERGPRGRTLRVFIDKPDKTGGVDVEDCAAVSHQLSRVLTVENVDYDRLEISSPGFDRVLKKPADFERFAGSRIELRLRLAVGGRRNFSGVLRGLRDGKVCLTVDTGEIEVDFDGIDKARRVPGFDR